MRGTRLVLVGALVAASAVGVAPAQAVAMPCSPTGYTREIAPVWLGLEPRFPAGPAAVTLAAAPAYAPDLLYASNGVQVLRSADAGCSWELVLDLSGEAVASIRYLAAPSSANSSSYLYVGADVGVAGAVTRPVVHVSRDRGETWASGSPESGLPPVGSVTSLAASPRLPQTAYALVAQRVADRDVTTAVWATGDGGRTWQQRTPPGTQLQAQRLVAAPQRENALFALGDGTVRLSSDGGRTFAPAGPPDAKDVTALDGAGGGGGIRLAVGRSGSQVISRSDDEGATWRDVPSPVAATRVAMAPVQDVVAAGTADKTWLLPPGGRVEVTPQDWVAPDQLQLSAPTEAGFALTGVADGAVLRSTYGLDFRAVPPVAGRPVRLLPFDPLRQFPSTLAPVSTRVALPVGVSTEIPYRLLLPRTPSPLDVMFLVDTTGSMGGVIDGLRQGLASIVSALNGSGLDVRVGLGDFKDYPSPYGGGGSDDYPYRLDRRIGIADAELARAIDQLQASGGGDGPESALTALYQSATGRGEVVRGRRFVAPGGQAGYRARTMRLDVLATDNPVHQRGSRDTEFHQYRDLGHTIDEVVRALRAVDVYAVGLAASPGAEPDMRRLATGTRTFAPRGGVDCDGDGAIDVREGAPLVCGIGGAAPASVGVSTGVTGTGAGGTVSLTGAVIGLAEALPDRQTVSLRVRRGSDVASVPAAVRRGVNLKADNELAYALRLTCPATAGTYPVELAARAAAREVATAGVQLVCAGPPARAPLAPAAGPADAPPAEPKGAPAAPGQPPNAPNPNPNPNPNANLNANPSVNLNPGAAAQEQQTQQLALVQSAATAETTEELAMSRPAPAVPAAAFVGAAGLLFLAACSFAVRTRAAEAHADRGS